MNRRAVGRPRLPARPLLAGFYHVVPLDRDRVQVANAGRSVILRGEAFAERVVPLLVALDGESTLEELQAVHAEILPDVLEGLLTHGLLTDAATRPDAASAAPSLAAFALGDAQSPSDVASRLGEATVAVAGSGPVSSSVAVLLGKAGVGRLLVSSEDTLSSRDIVVSPLLSPTDERQGSALVTYHRCLEMTSAEVEIVPSVAGADLAVTEVGYEEQETAYPPAEECLAGGIPYLLYGQDALAAIVGPLVGKGGRPCHHCLSARQLSHEVHLQEHLAYRRHRATAAPHADAFLAAHSSILAGFVAVEVLRALLGVAPLTHGAALMVDLATLIVTREELLLVPDCPVCGDAASGKG